MKLVRVVGVLALATCVATIFYVASRPHVRFYVPSRQPVRFDMPFILSIATVTKDEIKYSAPGYKKLVPLSDILQQYQQKFQSDGKYSKFYPENMSDPDMLAIIDYRVEDTDLVRICVSEFYHSPVTFRAPINGEHIDSGLKIDTWKKNAKWELIGSQ